MRHTVIKSILLCAGLWAAAPLSALELPSEPHETNSKLAPYSKAPKPVALSPKEMAKVKSGTPVYKPRSEGGVTEGTASFLAQAPVETVWKILLNFKMYPTWIGSSCKETLVYNEDAEHIDVGFKIYHWAAGNWTYFITHKINSQEHWMTWTLDRKYKSDIEDVRGAWVLTRNPENNNETIVYYYNTVIPGGALNIIKNLLTSQGLKTAVGWVIAQAKLQGAEANAKDNKDTKDVEATSKTTPKGTDTDLKSDKKESTATNESKPDVEATPKTAPKGNDSDLKSDKKKSAPPKAAGATKPSAKKQIVTSDHKIKN